MHQILSELAMLCS